MGNEMEEALKELITQYDNETDEAKQHKLEFKIERLDAIITQRKEEEKELVKPETIPAAKEPTDEVVCEKCGGDLTQTGETEALCERCGIRYELYEAGDEE